MHRRLVLKTVGIERKVLSLERWLIRESRAVPPPTGAEAAKISLWISRLREIRERMEDIRREVRPLVERDAGMHLAKPETLLLAMFQSSTKNLFSEIEIFCSRRSTCPFAPEEIRALTSIPEAAKVLAWIGDAALSLAVLTEIWSPELPDVGHLTERRKELVQNANLAILCDRWRLYEYRIHFDPPVDPSTLTRETLLHMKGTLTEAVFGVLFLQGGLPAITRAVPLLAPRRH